VWRNLRDLFPHPYGEAEAAAWLSYAAADPPPEGVYAIEVDGEAAGTVSLRRRDGEERFSAEIGYWLAEPYWGRGIMSEAVRAVAAAALVQPDVYRLFAPVFSWNPASMRVLEKAGFRWEGVLRRSAVKDGVLIDQVMYAITRDPGLPYSPAPAAPA
jgi:[ribosomal protein S5]-alanine N-acetyltransferase